MHFEYLILPNEDFFQVQSNVECLTYSLTTFMMKKLAAVNAKKKERKTYSAKKLQVVVKHLCIVLQNKPVNRKYFHDVSKVTNTNVIISGYKLYFRRLKKYIHFGLR